MEIEKGKVDLGEFCLVLNIVDIKNQKKYVKSSENVLSVQFLFKGTSKNSPNFSSPF
jgi:Neuraminidase (sialidase)